MQISKQEFHRKYRNLHNKTVQVMFTNGISYSGIYRDEYQENNIFVLGSLKLNLEDIQAIELVKE